MIFRFLKEYAIETRGPVKGTKLWNYDLETLEKCMKDKVPENLLGRLAFQRVRFDIM